MTTYCSVHEGLSLCGGWLPSERGPAAGATLVKEGAQRTRVPATCVCPPNAVVMRVVAKFLAAALLCARVRASTAPVMLDVMLLPHSHQVYVLPAAPVFCTLCLSRCLSLCLSLCLFLCPRA